MCCVQAQFVRYGMNTPVLHNLCRMGVFTLCGREKTVRRGRIKIKIFTNADILNLIYNNMEIIKYTNVSECTNYTKINKILLTM